VILQDGFFRDILLPLLDCLQELLYPVRRHSRPSPDGKDSALDLTLELFELDVMHRRCHGSAFTRTDIDCGKLGVDIIVCDPRWSTQEQRHHSIERVAGLSGDQLCDSPCPEYSFPYLPDIR